MRQHATKMGKRIVTLNIQLAQAELAKDFKRVRSIKKRKLKLELMTCSQAWYEQVCASGEHYPPIGMVLCRAEVRIGNTTNKGRRWTPKACADWEDAADLYGNVRYPSSVGCVVSMSDLKRGYVQNMDVE